MDIEIEKIKGVLKDLNALAEHFEAVGNASVATKLRTMSNTIADSLKEVQWNSACFNDEEKAAVDMFINLVARQRECMTQSLSRKCEKPLQP